MTESFHLAEATASERDAVLAHTHALCDRGNSLQDYKRQVADLLATPWGRDRYRFWIRKDAAGQVVASCKVYDLAMRLDGGVVRTIGIGAVFTLPEFRRQGHAEAMLRAIMGLHAERGFVLATLFSDIGAAYYEKLGFRTLPSREATARTERLPYSRRVTAFRRAETSDFARLLAMHHTLASDHGFAYHRDTDQMAFLVTWKRIPDLWLFELGGKPAGYLIGKPKDTLYRVFDGGPTDPEDWPHWLAGLRGVAEAHDATSVDGWLPDRHPAVTASFTWQERDTATWMAAPLADPGPDATALRAHCAWLDQF